MIIILFSVLLFSVPGVFVSNPSKKGMNAARKYNMQQICDQLEKYHSKNNYFPMSLLELEIEPKIIKDPKTGEDYLYAYYPEENPIFYHLGITLETKDAILNSDADFDSRTAGYINGFDGRGQVFDVHKK